MPQSVVPGGPVNARLRQKSMARVTNCDSQLSQSALCWGAEAFTRPLGELERLAHAGDLPGHTRCLPIFARKFRASGAPSRNLSKHCRPPIHNR